MSQPRRRWPARLVVVTGLVWWLGGTISAHDLGTSRAVVEFHQDGSFTVDILADPQNLLAQLALREGRTPPRFEADERVQRLRAELTRVYEGVELYFDGQRADASIEYQTSVTPSLAAGLTSGVGDAGVLRLSGRVPAQAQRFTFAYRWTYGAMPLVVQDGSPEPRIVWIGAGERSAPVSLHRGAVPDRIAVARQYLGLGFTHILPLGLDHILFVLGLFFLGAGWRALLLQVSTFTIAHTMTLGLTMLGVMSVSPSIVEPLIALSIAYVAIENLTTRTLRPSRVALILCFGLLHGMGFAGVLSELGLPSSRFLPALLSFNVGVECGQLAVLGIATLVVAGWRQREASLLPLVARPASLLIAASGLYWTVQRLASLT